MADEEVVHRSRVFKFIVNQIEAKNPIVSQGPWMSAYECYADAVEFAYPHRVEELANYRKYLLKLFNTVGPAKQRHVIQFDQTF